MTMTETSMDLAQSISTSDDSDFVRQAEEAVRGYCGWHIAPSKQVTMVLDGSGSSTLILPTLRLTDIASITSDGETVDLADVEWSEKGILRRTCGRWSCKLRGVIVSAQHGFAFAPADITGVVQAVAQRAKDNPGGLSSWTKGPFSETYATDLLSTEKMVLDRYKLPARS